VIFLVITLIIGGISPSFADNNDVVRVEDSNVKIQIINDNSLVFIENNQKLLVTVKENKNKTITTLKDLETGNEDYFLRDEIKGVIYSSITGETINIDDNINNTELYSSNERSSNERYIGRRYVKYSKVLKLVGVGAGISKMASGIMTLLKIPVSTGIKGIVAVLAGLGGATAGILSLKYPNGGIRLDLYDVRRYKIQRGKKYYYWQRIYKNVKHISVM
ncbi:MAG: hypothetical protein ACTHWU_09680, partial [Senegalia sp. (in: firmicutes)]|uniref:hypothetical protein n=1 Tax=Senegalia sp. (in: firmicutes) TaxID=1924098 RepID=UPI003F9C077C